MLSSLRDFLPRGSGIVTRRPLVLQLISSTAGELTFAVFTGPSFHTQARPPSIHFAITQSSLKVLVWFSNTLVFNPAQSGRSSCTAKARSSQTLTRCARRSRQKPIVSQEPTREYHPSPSTCGFTPLTVRCLCIVSESCDISVN